MVVNYRLFDFSELSIIILNSEKSLFIQLVKVRVLAVDAG